MIQKSWGGSPLSGLLVFIFSMTSLNKHILKSPLNTYVANLSVQFLLFLLSEIPYNLFLIRLNLKYFLISFTYFHFYDVYF